MVSTPSSVLSKNVNPKPSEVELSDLRFTTDRLYDFVSSGAVVCTCVSTAAVVCCTVSSFFKSPFFSSVDPSFFSGVVAATSLVVVVVVSFIKDFGVLFSLSGSLVVITTAGVGSGFLVVSFCAVAVAVRTSSNDGSLAACANNTLNASVRFAIDSLLLVAEAMGCNEVMDCRSNKFNLPSASRSR